MVDSPGIEPDSLVLQTSAMTTLAHCRKFIVVYLTSPTRLGRLTHRPPKVHFYLV